MSNFADRVAKSVGRHFVTLSCLQHPPPPAESRVHVFSGFVMNIAGEWFYATAGHILRDIRSAQATGSSFTTWRLGDQTATNEFAGKAVPYDFRVEHWCVLEDADVGLDYAAVHIGGLFRQQLEAGGLVPFSDEAWGDHTMKHDYWALVGIPRESVSYDGESVISARVVLAPLVGAEPPPLSGKKAMNQFYAKLADDSDGVVRNVEGMSGGPVIMLRYVDDTWKYRVIGVQSGWYPGIRTVAVCPFTSFAMALQPVVQEALVKASELQGLQGCNED